MVHPDATLGVLITHGVKVQWPQLADAASMLAVICRELQASSPATTVPNTAREPVAQVVPVARIIPEPVVPVVAPARRGPVTPVSPVPPSVDPVPIIPDEECAACDTKSPFVSRVEERKGEIYAVYRCPSCREDFTVYSSALAAKLSAWVEQHAVASGESREALLAEVLLNPRADLPRLRFAAVVARVDPFRAELVRVQIVAARQRRLGKSASAPDFDALAYRLQSSAVRVNRWYAGIDALVQPGLSCMTTRQLEFRRGFVEGVCLTARQFVERAGSLYHLAPILDLGVTELGSASPDFFASPHLAQLRSLCLYNTGVTDADIRRLAESPHLARLAYLDVGYGHVTEAGVEALCASRCLPELRFVRLLHNACDDPNPTSDEQDGRRYGLIPSAASSALRQKFGPVPWLNDRYCSEDPPHVETFP